MIKVTVAGWTNPEYNVSYNDVILTSPSGLTGVFTEFANQIYQWCADRGIEVDLISKYSDSSYNDVSTWRIENEEHRTMFVLRWS
jgi:hypothetical protein